MWYDALTFAVLLAAPRALCLRNLRSLHTSLLGVQVWGKYATVQTQKPDSDALAMGGARFRKKETGARF